MSSNLATSILPLEAKKDVSGGGGASYKEEICQVPYHSLSSPLIQAALKLGLVVKSVELYNPYHDHSRKPILPMGHRFYRDCLREQEARLLEWLIKRFQGHAWFFTLTFKDWLYEERAGRMASDFLARLNQAHKEIPGAAPLMSTDTTEWQQRDVIHYHLLIFGNELDGLSRKRWEHRWQMSSGGFAANYDAEVKAAPYLVKHQTKDQSGGNMHLGGSWRGITPPRSVSKCCIVSNGFRDVATAFNHATMVTALEK
ncbi:unnamed protein product [marine sediment metagenome]|uniref:Replication-associated protein ORF2/G2P domain-containing protein n=1 Tax=marine sediment metagenome TaxID=412755 RepID=X1R0C1_9ZZZZ